MLCAGVDGLAVVFLGTTAELDSLFRPVLPVLSVACAAPLTTLTRVPFSHRGSRSASLECGCNHNGTEGSVVRKYV
jgi:hypothetical protein